MKVFRAALVAVIVVNLALLAASAPLRATLRRYDVARKQQELRKLSLENRTLLHQAAVARRPDQVAARAAAFGIDLHAAEPDAIVKEDSPRRPPGGNAPPQRPPRPPR